jgi:hypothetical protein
MINASRMLNINTGIFLLFSLFLIFIFIAPTSINGQTPQNSNNTNQTAADTKADTAAESLDKIFNSYLPFYFLGVIAVAMVVPLIVDMFFAYKNKLKRSIGNENSPPVGMQGLYRTLMTFGVILLVGTVIFYVLVLITLNLGNQSGSPVLQSLIDMLKNLSAILGTALATIIAFYFGMRGAESAATVGAGAASVRTETIAPTIVGTYPADGQKGILVYSDIVASFSKQMDSSTIDVRTFKLKKNDDSSIIKGSVTLTSDGQAAMLNPLSDLEPSTKYTATITKEVKDVTGSAMTTDKTWSFETEAAIAPTIVGTYPPDAQKEISVHSDIVASFSKQMDSSTINSSTFTLKKNDDSSIIKGSVTLTSDGKAAMLNPLSDLEPSTKYTATITKEVKDVTGIAMTTDKTWSFETKAVAAGGEGFDIPLP